MASANAASFHPRLNHTMLRVKDIAASIKFYTDVLGMEVIDEHDGGDFSLTFLDYPKPQFKGQPRGQREAILELTWNKGTEKDPKFSYRSGNEDEHKGFGHIAVSVDSVDDFCKYLDTKGVRFRKRPEEGKMRNIAFILDPDGYWVEIVPGGKLSA